MAVHLIFCRIIVEVVRPLPSPRSAPPPPPPPPPAAAARRKGPLCLAFCKISHLPPLCVYVCTCAPPPPPPPPPLSPLSRPSLRLLLHLHLRHHLVLALRRPGSPMVFRWIRTPQDACASTAENLEYDDTTEVSWAMTGRS